MTNKEQWDAEFNKQYKAILKFCFKNKMPQDAIHDAYLKCLGVNFELIEKPTGFIKKILSNSAIENYRKHRYVIDGKAYTYNQVGMELLDLYKFYESEESIIDNEIKNKIMEIIYTMPPIRQKIMLRVMEGHTIPEITKELNVGYDGINRAFQIGRQKLKEVLNETN